MSMIERRAEERAPKVLIIRYCKSEADGKPASRLGFALTSNVSKSGISFRSLKPVNGQVRLISEALWDSPKEGVVKWCSETLPGVFKVGVALS